MATKRNRSGRATETQMSAMLDFFLSNNGMAEGKFQVINGRETLQKKWEELANDLNGMKGAHKTVAQWQVTWRDLKSKTSQKVRKIRQERHATGNNSIKNAELGPIELKVIGIVGSNYIEGSQDCPDSLPEEEDLQEQLVAGKTSILMMPPKVLNVCKDVPNLKNDNTLGDGNCSEIREYVDDDMFEVEYLEEDVPEYRRQTTTDVKQNSGKSYLQAPKRKERSIVGSGVSSSTAPKRRKDGKLSEQLSLAREQMTEISQTHAEAMMTLAEAAKIQANAAVTQAEATVRLAEAIDKQADAAMQHAANDSARIEIMSQLVQVLSQMLPNYSP